MNSPKVQSAIISLQESLSQSSKNSLWEIGNTAAAEWLLESTEKTQKNNFYLAQISLEASEKCYTLEAWNVAKQTLDIFFWDNHFQVRAESKIYTNYLLGCLKIAQGLQEKLNEITDLSDVYFYIGLCLISLERVSESLGYFHKSYELFVKENSMGGKKGSLYYLSVAYYELNQEQKALEYAQQLLTLSKEMGDPDSGIKAYQKLTDIYKLLQTEQIKKEYFDSPKICLIKQLCLARIGDFKLYELGAIDYLMEILNTQSWVRTFLYDRHFFQTFSRYKSDDENIEIECWFILGKIFLKKGNGQKGIQYLHRAEEKTWFSEHLASIYQYLGYGYFLTNNSPKSIDYANKELTSIEESSLSRKRQIRPLKLLARLHFQSKQYEQALDYYQQILTIQEEVKENQLSISMSATLKEIGDTLYCLKRYDESIKYFEKTIRIQNSLIWTAIAQEGFKRLISVKWEQIEVGRINYYKSCIKLGKYHKPFINNFFFLSVTGIYILCVLLKFLLWQLPYGILHILLTGESLFDTKKKSWKNNKAKVQEFHQTEVDYYLEALANPKLMEDSGRKARCYYYLGIAYFALEEYQKALEAFQQSLLIYQPEGNDLGQADCLVYLARLYNDYLKEYPTALDFSQQALTLYQKLDDKAGIADSSYLLGVVLHNLNQSQNAIEPWQQALAINRERGYDYGEAQCLYWLGLTYTCLFQQAKAEELLLQALDIHRGIENIEGQYFVSYQLGCCYGFSNDYGKSLNLLRESLNLAQILEDKEKIAGCWRSIGIQYNSLGQFNQSLAYYTKCVRYFRTEKKYEDLGWTLSLIGSVHTGQQKYRQALKYYQKSLDTFQKVNPNTSPTLLDNKVMTLFAIGCSYAEQKNYLKALEYCQQAFALDPNKTREVFHLANLGHIYNKLSQYQQSIQFYQDALSLFQKMNSNIHQQASCFYLIAENYTQMEQYEDAKKHYFQALILRKAENNSVGQSECLTALKNVYQKLNPEDTSNPSGFEEFLLENSIHSEGKKEVLRESLECYVLLYNAGTEQEGIHTISQGSHETILLFESSIEAQSFAQQLEVKNFPIPSVEKIAFGEIMVFCQNSGYSWELVKEGDNRKPPTSSLLNSPTQIEKKGQADLLLNQGYNQIQLGQNRKAIQPTQQALTLYQELENKQDEAVCFNNLGAICFNLRKYRQALSYHQQALALRQLLENKNDEFITLDCLITICFKLKELPQAKEYINRCLTLAEELNKAELKCKSLELLGKYFLKIKDYNRGIQYAIESCCLAREFNVKDISPSSFLLSFLYSGQFFKWCKFWWYGYSTNQF